MISISLYLSIGTSIYLSHYWDNGNGAKENHNLIMLNAGSESRKGLKVRPCKVYLGDIRVRVPATGLYAYPDLSVVCGEPQFEDGVNDTLLNPILIVEVLSESTEAYDRGKKFGHYRKISSHQEYVLVSQDHYEIENFLKQSEIDISSTDVSWAMAIQRLRNEGWELFEESDLKKSIELPAIQCWLSLNEVYDKVEF